MINKLLLKGALFPILTIMLFAGCDQLTNSKVEKHDTLHVKFINDSTSTHTITTIQLKAMGKVDDENAVADTVWGADILEERQNIAPGEHRFFDLNIPNLHYCIYCLGVDDGTGKEVFLDEQPEYNEDNVFILIPTITHWGSDDRTVSVRLAYNQEKNLIYIGGWEDFAGIE